MSIFIFGEFNSLDYDNNFDGNMVKNLNNDKIVYLVNRGMDGIKTSGCNIIKFGEVNLMLSENKRNEYKNKFLLVTEPGLVTSDGVINVFDVYDDEELFPDGNNEDITNLELKQANLLNQFKDSLLIFIDKYNINKIRIFTTAGYDTKESFNEIDCTIDEMIKIIGEQLALFPEPDSFIYNIIL